MSLQFHVRNVLTIVLSAEVDFLAVSVKQCLPWHTKQEASITVLFRELNFLKAAYAGKPWRPSSEDIQQASHA